MLTVPLKGQKSFKNCNLLMIKEGRRCRRKHRKKIKKKYSVICFALFFPGKLENYSKAVKFYISLRRVSFKFKYTVYTSHVTALIKYIVGEMLIVWQDLPTPTPH
jgi:hypothetical protein